MDLSHLGAGGAGAIIQAALQRYGPQLSAWLRGKPGVNVNGNGNGYGARFDKLEKSVGDLSVVLKELAAATNRMMDWIDKQDKAQEQSNLADAVAAKLRHGKAASV